MTDNFAREPVSVLADFLHRWSDRKPKAGGTMAVRVIGDPSLPSYLDRITLSYMFYDNSTHVGAKLIPPTANSRN